MSSSYSSLDWVLSHVGVAHFTVHRFSRVCMFVLFIFSYCISVILLYHGEVDLVGLKPNP